MIHFYVGYGDIHAVGTLGRVLISVQMIFDLIYLGTAFRLLSLRDKKQAETAERTDDS